MKAEVILEYDSACWAEAVADAVSGDNVKTPVGLSVRTICAGRKVVTNVECGCRLITFIATIDDLLFSASSAEKVLRATERLC